MYQVALDFHGGQNRVQRGRLMILVSNLTGESCGFVSDIGVDLRVCQVILRAIKVKMPVVY